MTFRFDNSWIAALPGTYLAAAPDPAPAPRLLAFNRRLAEGLGLDAAALETEAAELLSGARLPAGAEPIAQAYAGHQFGGFSPQLGDGRAHLLGEVVDGTGRRWDIQLKGSGRTPFSRGGDGKAAVGPMLREYVMGEAMAALGIPTTRALAVVATGAPVLREVELPGAVLTRVAASHIRVGTFQFFAARGDQAQVRKLADYTIARHYPDCAGAENPYVALFDQVIARQARLIAQWMGVGFIHGVMNTDNMALSGETIDYGPCAFMEGYAAGTVFSSIDHGGRYAYANQPLILGWNLARLAESLLGLFDADQDRAVDMANGLLEGIAGRYRAEWVAVMRAKLGLAGAEEGDGDLADGLLAVMEGQGADWTLVFRRLAGAVGGDATGIAPLFDDPTGLRDWLPRWQARLAPDAASRIRAANPAVIPRNHKVEEALAAATGGDMAPFDALVAAVSEPFVEREAYMLPAPQGFGRYVTFCGT
ncbi:YdiU family protein [Rhodobacteraceae bacterium HSP-20]|uniref:Protein nucleotidyltransferase YdiU n=1 Tax=Paragemmobacter amnigenus TaxID=2852097 RepID=A0ABS6IYT5_9RHOB|nr:YdiU family protein [Rhodobacter amnigenus]MBU9696679.1 YdiU family protein [Rhodobacter amnigenus]MBV4387906.1 YdiU family protein [Rhodobacter amnigenus]